MAATGFLGTRADPLVDIAVVVFIAAPFLIAYALRRARQRRFRSHKRIQLAVLLTGIVAVLLLEVSIRFGGASQAYRESSLHGHAIVKFFVHLFIAIPTFASWCALAIVSSRRFSRELPGSFSAKHRRWGGLTYAGVLLTCITGAGLYVMVFAL